MVRIHVDNKKAVLYAENAFKRDLLPPLAKAAAQAIATAPKDSGRMAGAISSRVRKEGSDIVGAIGIFNSTLKEAPRQVYPGGKGTRSPRPSLAKNLWGVTKGRPFMYRPEGKLMTFRPRGGATHAGFNSFRTGFVLTNFVKEVPANKFILRAMEKVAARYNAGLKELQ